MKFNITKEKTVQLFDEQSNKFVRTNRKNLSRIDGVRMLDSNGRNVTKAEMPYQLRTLQAEQQAQAEAQNK